jgi:hypothetical protein
VTAIAMLVAAGAFAAAPAVAASGTGPATGVAAAPQAVVSLSLPDAFVVSGQPVTVPKRVVHVVGTVRPYVPGQSVKVRTFLAGRLLKSQRVPIAAAGGGAYGAFRAAVSSPAAGELTVVVGHSRTTTLQSFIARRSLPALDENVGFGATGRFVALLQQRLAALHFYIPQTGVYDEGTGLALDAYHRLLGWGTYQTLDPKTVSWLLDGFGSFKVRYPGDGKHAEGDIGDQLLALIDGSKVFAIYPISSGKPSTPTVLGRFSVYSKVPGYLPDGMYYSNFFIGGYAIHGYDPAPDYPASHGCMRLPIVDAISVYNWIQYGDRVDVYL